MKRGGGVAASSDQQQASSMRQQHASTATAAAAGAAAGAAPVPATAGAGAGAGVGAAGGAQEERTNYLVALAGMRALTAHIQDASKGKNWIERVKGWEEKAGLTEPSVKLALGFLDILGVSE